MGAALALGNVIGYEWTAYLSIILTWWAVPLAVHFHLLFPSRQPYYRLHQVIWLGYVPPLLASLRILEVADLVQWPQELRTFYAGSFYFWVVAGLAMVLLLLFRSYRTATDMDVQRRLGLVSMSGFLSFTPLLTLSILPQLVLGTPFLPIELGLLFLIGIPVGYGYAITRYQFIRLERYVNRSTAAVLLIGILSAVHFVALTLLGQLLPDNTFRTPLSSFVAAFLIIILYKPLYRRLRQFTDALFYGGWYDYPSVVSEISRFLNKTTDVEFLAASLSNSIQKTMRVHWACLLVRNNENPLNSTVEYSGNPPFSPELVSLHDMPSIVSYLDRRRRPVPTHELATILDPETMTEAEQKLLHALTVRLWVPIRGRQQLGMLLLGPKFGGSLFNDVDMNILKVVARQASMALENVGLIKELEARVQENERYQREVMRVRERERKRISRELHDQVIQSLVGLNYQLANVQSSLNLVHLNPEMHQQTEKLRENVGHLIEITRNLCQDLRPPALDLGLLQSIRSAAGRFQKKTGIEVDLTVSGDRTVPIQEDIALCLFRCTNEALANVRKHAEASHVNIELDIRPALIRLTIEDNGRGFEVPPRLGHLMDQNHFGLVGMRERLELIDGYFQITSNSSTGTRLVVSVPLQPARLPTTETAPKEQNYV